MISDSGTRAVTYGNAAGNIQKKDGIGLKPFGLFLWHSSYFRAFLN